MTGPVACHTAIRRTSSSRFASCRRTRTNRCSCAPRSSYAVCEKLCLPVEAEAELSFTSTASALDSLVATALNKVPKPVGTSEATPLAVRGFKRVGDRVIVDVAAQNTDKLELFAEGPSPDWALPVPKRVEAAEKGIVRFEFKLEGLPANAKAEGAQLKLTLVGADGAFEYNVRLN